MDKSEKLTLVSLVYHGRRKSAFVKGYLDENGKTVVPNAVIDKLFRHMCGFINCRGLTITIGG